MGAQGSLNIRVMRWNFVGVIIGFFMAFILGCGQVENSPHRFVVIGDSQGNLELPVNVTVLRPMVEEILNLNPRPAFVLWVGDMVAYGGRDELQFWRNEVEPLTAVGIKHYTVVGSHELGNPDEQDSAMIEQALMKQLEYQDFSDLPLNGPPGYDELVYSFDSGDIHVAVLDSFYHNGQEWQDNEINDEQLLWLETDLAGSTKLFKFVATHSPAYPVAELYGVCLDKNMERRDAFWRVLDRNNVAMFFAGHEHSYSRWKIDSNVNSEWTHDVVQVITGGGGGQLRSIQNANANPDYFVAVHHFIVVDVIEGDSISVKAYNIVLDYFIKEGLD